jgi:hypothetical protein
MNFSNTIGGTVMKSTRLILNCVVGASLAGLSASAWAVNYDEGVSGDLSNIPSSVTGIGALSVGANALIATSGGGDFDHLGFSIGAGTQLDTIVLTTYGGATQSFTALQNGTVWTAGVGGAVNAAATLGYTHFGPAAAGAGVGQDILDNMGVAAGAVGFTPPLGNGAYNMLLQDTGGAVSYSLTFNVSSTVIPEPASASLLAMALAIGCVSGRSWRRNRR